MKQVIVVNTALNMPVGKLAAQVAHASNFACQMATSTPDGGRAAFDGWAENAFVKVVLRGEDSEHLECLVRIVRNFELPYFLVRDAGRTVLEPGAITALGIGPADIETIDKVTGGLKLL